MKKLSYKLFGAEEFMRPKGPIMSGLFAWFKAFNTYGIEGYIDANLSRRHLETYDIIHINYTPGCGSYATALRDTLGYSSDTKIIMNVDFALGMWSRIDPYILREQLNKADMIFHVEPVGAARLSRFMGLNVPCIPHPVDVDKIQSDVLNGEKEDGTPKVTKSPFPSWTCQFHRYMYTWDPYFYALYPLRKDFNFSTVLSNIAINDNERYVPLNSFFDECVMMAPYEQYLTDVLGRAWFNMDVTMDYTYGRGIVDAAAMGVPTIGSDSIYAAKVCFPALMVRFGDDKTAGELAKRLMSDGEFAQNVSNESIENASFFNLKNSYRRMITALESGAVI